MLCLHLLHLSVTIEMLSPYLIIIMTVMLISWKEFNIAASNTKNYDELKDDSTPLRHSILVPNSVKTETIFPSLNPQNLITENKFMYNNIPVLQAYPLLAVSRFSPYFPVLKRPLVLDYSASHLPLPFPPHFRPSPYFSSFRRPNQYSLRPSVTSHVPCPYYCKVFFSSLSRIAWVTPTVSLITSFFF